MDSEDEMGLQTSIISVITEEMKSHWSIPQGSIPVEMSDCELCFIFISSKFLNEEFSGSTFSKRRL